MNLHCAFLVWIFMCLQGGCASDQCPFSFFDIGPLRYDNYTAKEGETGTLRFNFTTSARSSCADWSLRVQTSPIKTPQAWEGFDCNGEACKCARQTDFNWIRIYIWSCNVTATFNRRRTWWRLSDLNGYLTESVDFAINVTAPPALNTFSWTPSSALKTSRPVALNSIIQLNCSWDAGNPPKESLILRHPNGTILPVPTPRIDPSQPGQRVTVADLRVSSCEDAGQYSCAMPETNLTAMTTTVLVQCPPKFLPRSPSRGQPVRVGGQFQRHYTVLSPTARLTSCELQELNTTLPPRQLSCNSTRIVVTLKGEPPTLTLVLRLLNVSERDAHPWILKLSNEYRSTLRDPATASTTFTVQVQTDADPIVDPGNINKNASRVNVLAVVGPAAGGLTLVFFVVVTVVVFKGKGGLRPGLRRFWQKVFGDGDHIYAEITDFQGFRESTNLKQLLSDDPAIPLLSTPTFLPRSNLDNASPTRDAGVQTLLNSAHPATPTYDGPIKTTQNPPLGFISVSTQTKPNILKKPNPRRAKPANGSAPDSEYENLIGSESAQAPPTDPLNSQSDSPTRQGNKPRKTSRRRRVLDNQSFPSMSGSSDQSNPPDSSVQSGASACRGNIQSNEPDDQYEIPVDNVNPKKDQDCQEGYMYMKYP